MTAGGRAAFDAALHRARLAAYPPGEFVGQESFMQAREILALARRAGIGPGVSVLDLCCGVAGPGRYVTAELGCSYWGVDSCRSAVDLARERAVGLPCRFEVGTVPPVPPGPFDVVLLLETMLAFPDRTTLLAGVAGALKYGGRFGLTVEEGPPLTPAERSAMPASDTVWPVSLPDLLAELAAAGLRVRWLADVTAAHRRTAGSLADAFAADRSAISRALGMRALEDLIAAHRLWGAWFAQGRARKLAIVAERIRPAPSQTDGSKS